MVSLLIIDLFAMAVVVLILLNVRRYGRNHLVEQKIFCLLAEAIVVTIFLDMCMWFLDGRDQPWITYNKGSVDKEQKNPSRSDRKSRGSSIFE